MRPCTIISPSTTNRQAASNREKYFRHVLTKREELPISWTALPFYLGVYKKPQIYFLVPNCGWGGGKLEGPSSPGIAERYITQFTSPVPP